MPSHTPFVTLRKPRRSSFSVTATESSAGTELLRRLCAPAGDPLSPPRTLLALAHPGDETVGAASRLTRIDAAAFVYATSGAPSDLRPARAAGCETAEEYAQLRRRETFRALAHVGISSERVVFLDYPDQQAALRLAPLAADLRRWIVATQPEVVLTHSYEGVHPDHDAVAFAVHAAVAAVRREEGTGPTIIEFATDQPHDNETDCVGYSPCEASAAYTVQLTADGRALKQRLLACHRSQAHMGNSFLLDEESFRLAPAYDFTRPPCEGGPQYYEQHGGGLTATQWIELVAAAQQQLAAIFQTCVLK